MNNWTAISKSTHAESCWRPRENYQRFSRDVISPIIPEELGKLVADYVLIFTQQEEAYAAGALLGIERESNLYVSLDGKWLAAYVPAMYRAFPFALGNDEDSNRILCIEEGFVQEAPGGERLFDSEGNLETRIVQILEFLEARDRGLRTMHHACELIAELELFTEWPLQIAGVNDQTIQMGGLFCIDEEKLNKLDAETFSKLRQSGALPLIYAHLLSMSHVDQLAKRLSMRHSHSQPGSDISDLSELFNSDDNLNFEGL